LRIEMRVRIDDTPARVCRKPGRRHFRSSDGGGDGNDWIGDRGRRQPDPRAPSGTVALLRAERRGGRHLDG